jgi:hypothetical protein
VPSSLQGGDRGVWSSVPYRLLPGAINLDSILESFTSRKGLWGRNHDDVECAVGWHRLDQVLLTQAKMEGQAQIWMRLKMQVRMGILQSNHLACWILAQLVPKH